MRASRSLARLLLAAAVAVVGGALMPARAAASDIPFTVGNYPVEATAQNAVAAKEKAMADGQQAALRSLIKRLVPVTSYPRIAKMRLPNAADLVDGVAVRSERNSSTQYIASLDFSFQPEPVRALLKREGLPFVDAQAQTVTVVPIYRAPPAGQGPAPVALAAAGGGQTWREAWRGLDLDHALAPVKLEAPKAALTPQIIDALKEGDGEAQRALARAYGTGLILAAIAEGDVAAGRLHVTLVGNDAVGGFVLKRSYRLLAEDFPYTAELGAVVALGVLEGRWKASRAPTVTASVGGGAAPAGVPEHLQLFVEFRSMAQWNDIRRRISETPGIEEVEVGGLSARGASVAASFPGGGPALAAALAGQGLDMRNLAGTWVVRAPN